MCCGFRLLLGVGIIGASAVATQAGDDRDAPSGLVAKPDLFATLVNPPCSHCKDEAARRGGELRTDDRVGAWIRGKYQGGAIPLRFFLVPYRVISDTYGVFVYDADAGFVRGFEPSLDFTFYGFHKGIMVIRYKDGTLYSALSGRGLAGPNKHRTLKPVATLTTDWGPWLEAYPDTVAYHMFPKYTPLALPTTATRASRESRTTPDRRLDGDTRVLGLALGDHARAYPLDPSDKTIRLQHDTVAGRDVNILWYGPTGTAVAFASRTDGPDSRRLTLSIDPDHPAAPILDRETASHWDFTGRAVAGPQKGRTLEWLPGVACRWFAWAAEYPDTVVKRPAH